jgi:gas vesicle protein
MDEATTNERNPRVIIVEVDTIGSLFRGLLWGSLIGAAIALLMTPQPGEKNRSLLNEKSSEVKTRVQEIAAEARVRANHVVASARGMESNGHSQELSKENQILDDDKRKMYDL